ncbi:glycosyltransferase family 2 protein [Pseudomonas sp. GD03842]|uniref:glycosyltransferase family 2 protein n=1 Tax=unclassified Pseudomonas TaxID=196821 RepID=UPI000D3AE760|nr:MULTISPECIES: glycosyltransferase family A protein [unclassified Pseudomonas]MDH0746571.1 glycosyltransferase family 2 protein [Pseudomonas sp. GD03842]RAU46623.1 glycosyltransferase family 2 protein [Pseudomonas sp. RIT 409]RAU52599.1 glycosyltransferase family 2 protein [Pseudomonas sp. RIT 412]
MKWPLVSILVPCFNHELYIEECLRSILAQDYDNFELIVVNDGSTDGSAAKIEALQRLHGFQFYQQPNMGVSAALNLALSHARGEFIVTHDSDDIMLAGRIRRQVSYMQEHPEVGLLGAKVIYIDSIGRPIKHKVARQSSVQRWSFDQLLADAYAVGAPVAMYRREAIDHVGGYDPAIKVQDFQMTLRIAQAGYQVDILPDRVTLYRRHATNISKTAYKSQLVYDLKVIEAYRDNPAYEAGRLAIINKALKESVVTDKKFARGLFASIPVHRWNRLTWKRFRHFVFKYGKPKGAQ